MSARRSAIVLLAAVLLAIAAFATIPTGEPPESVTTAGASAPTEQQHRGVRVVATTTTQAPTTTTTSLPTAMTAPLEPEQQEAPPSGGAGDPNDDASWYRLAACETGGTMDWAINTGNGYYGGLQFSLGSWQSVGGQGYPHEASPGEQIARGKLLYAQGGWAHWPGCTRSFGWR